MALFTMSEIFLTLQTVTRQKILMCYCSPRQNFNFFDKRFLRLEKHKKKKKHVKNVFNVPVGPKHKKCFLKNGCDFVVTVNDTIGEGLFNDMIGLIKKT